MEQKDILEQIVEKEKIFKGHIIEVEKWQVRLPSNKLAAREAVVHSGGVCAFALCPNGTVPLVCQHRVVAGEVLWELPAGKREKGEDPLQAIQRELEEEVGIRANHWEKLTSFYATPAYCTEVIHVFYAEDTWQTAQKLDTDEFLKVEFFPLEKVEEMALNGQIKDGKTLIGVFMALHKIRCGQ